MSPNKLSELLTFKINDVKILSTREEINSFVKKLISNNNLLKETSAQILLKQLAKSKSYEESIQYVWNMIVSDSGRFVGKEVTKKSWYKGTAISGMECHSH